MHVYTKYSEIQMRSVSLYDIRFRDTKGLIAKCRKSKMHGMASEKHEALTAKSTLYRLRLYHQPQILVRFTLRPAIFKIHGGRKPWNIENAPNDPAQTDFERLTNKSTLHILPSTFPRSPNFVGFLSTKSRFQDIEFLFDCHVTR